jgi:SAM-dependent methyltransferase
MSEAAEFWEALYRERGRAWSGRPNVALVREVADLEPGTALDLGSGEGGDAIWLAARGWTVTGVDVASNALALAETSAEEAGLGGRIRWLRADLGSWHPEGSYDLVTAHFLHSTVALPRVEVLKRAARAVAPGGLLLVVGHSALPGPSAHPPEHAPVGGHHEVPEMRQTPAEVLESLALDDAEWTVVTLELVERETTMPGGESRRVTDNVVGMRRAGPTSAG